MIGPKLKTLFRMITLAVIFVLLDQNTAMAFGLDPSEIKISAIVVPALTAAGIIVWKIKTWIYADGHTEDVESSTSNQDDN